MLLKEWGNTDAVVLRPEERPHDLLCGIVPSGKGPLVWVCIRKQDDLVTSQGDELVSLHLAHASCGQPDVLGIEFREDDGRLLGFDNGDSRWLMMFQQMKAEETMQGLEDVLRRAVVILQEI